MKTSGYIYATILAGLFLFINSHIVGAQTCTFSGTPWTLTVSAADVADAGTDVTPTYTSAANQSVFDLYYDLLTEWTNNYTWSVQVRMSIVDWPGGVTLAVRRTGAGSNYFRPGQIQNGQSFITLGGTNQPFFNGRRGRVDVPIEYRISNVSVTIPAKSYSTTVIYTITTSI